MFTPDIGACRGRGDEATLLREIGGVETARDIVCLAKNIGDWSVAVVKIVCCSACGDSGLANETRIGFFLYQRDRKVFRCDVCGVRYVCGGHIELNGRADVQNGDI